MFVVDECLCWMNDADILMCQISLLSAVQFSQILQFSLDSVFYFDWNLEVLISSLTSCYTLCVCVILQQLFTSYHVVMVAWLPLGCLPFLAAHRCLSTTVIRGSPTLGKGDRGVVTPCSYRLNLSMMVTVVLFHQFTAVYSCFFSCTIIAPQSLCITDIIVQRNIVLCQQFVITREWLAYPGRSLVVLRNDHNVREYNFYTLNSPFSNRKLSKSNELVWFSYVRQ